MMSKYRTNSKEPGSPASIDEHDEEAHEVGLHNLDEELDRLSLSSDVYVIDSSFDSIDHFRVRSISVDSDQQRLSLGKSQRCLDQFASLRRVPTEDSADLVQIQLPSNHSKANLKSFSSDSTSYAKENLLRTRSISPTDLDMRLSSEPQNILRRKYLKQSFIMKGSDFESSNKQPLGRIGEK